MRDRILWLGRELIAVFFWVFALLKVFVLDADVLVLERLAPGFVPFLNYRLLFFLGGMAIAWLGVGNRRFMLGCGYILTYPLIQIVWRIPRLVLRQRNWSLVLALTNAIVSTFYSVKYLFISASFYLIAFVVAFNSSHRESALVAVSLLLVLLAISYARRFFLIFRSQDIYRLHVAFFSGIRKHGTASFALEEGLRTIPRDKMDERQTERWTTNLQLSVMFNRVCVFWSRRLRDYQKSGFIAVSHLITTLLLIAWTVICYTAINYGLYTFDPSLFASNSSPPGVFDFFYYSFNNIIFNSVADLTPVGTLAKLVYVAQTFSVLVLLAIFISLLFTHKGQRQVDELDSAIRSLDTVGLEMEGLIRKDYRIESVEQAIVELEKLKASFTNFLLKLSAGIK